MPPKCKKKGKKGKKGIHSVPEVHPIVLRRIEADRKKTKKQSARHFKKKRKRTYTATLVNDFSESIQELMHYEGSCEDSLLQDSFDISQSICSEPNLSLAEGHGEKQEFGNRSKANRKNGKDRASVLEKSTCSEPNVSLTEGHELYQEFGNRSKANRKTGKDRASVLENGTCSEPNVSLTGGQEVKQEIGDRSKVNKKSGKGRASVEEKSLMESNTEVLHIPKDVAETVQDIPKNHPEDKKFQIDADQTHVETRKEWSGNRKGESLIHWEPTKKTKENIVDSKSCSRSRVYRKNGKYRASAKKKSLVESKPYDTDLVIIPERKCFKNNAATLQDCSKRVPYDKELDKHQDKTESEIGKECAGNLWGISLKSGEPIKSAECTSDSEKKGSPKVPKNMSEDLSKKKTELQQKLQKFEIEMKCLEEKKKKVLLLGNRKKIKELEIAIIGDVCTSYKTDIKYDDKSNTYSHYDEDKRTLHIGDEHVKISIIVNKGSQVICKSRRLPNLDSCQDKVALHSQILGNQATIKLDKDIVSDSETHGKSEFDTIFTSSNTSEFPCRDFQTLEDQAIARPIEDILTDSELQRVTTTEIVRKPSKENSDLGSMEASLRKVCDDFLRTFMSTCEKFEARIINHMKGDKN